MSGSLGIQLDKKRLDCGEILVLDVVLPELLHRRAQGGNAESREVAGQTGRLSPRSIDATASGVSGELAISLYERECLWRDWLPAVETRIPVVWIVICPDVSSVGVPIQDEGLPGIFRLVRNARTREQL